MGTYYDKGRYRCRVTAQGLGKSQEKQTPFFYVKFEPLAFINHNSEEPCIEFKERTCKRFLTDKTLEYAIEDLQTLGLHVDAPSQIDPEHPNHVSIVGKEVEMFCKHDKNDKGDEYENWSVARQFTAAEIAPVAKDERKKLDSMFGNAFKAARKMSGATAPPPRPKSESMLITDDDVPF